MIKLLFILALLLSTTSCNRLKQNKSSGGSNDRDSESEPGFTTLSLPDFNADSAYHYVAKQIGFGPRVPNTIAHVQCGDWLQSSLERFSDTVYLQQTRLRAWDGTILPMRNLVGVFQPDKRNRILLCAHWDTRPWADHDPNPANHYLSFDGANDGASGVGVLLEVARVLSENKPDVGVDIIFFDAEDYGMHRLANSANEDSWGLGSQFWSNNPHRSDYNANFGILLDMVGAANPVFKQEGYSLMYAPNIVRKVWRIAHEQGFEAYFPNTEGGYIIDDHYYVNKIRKIPVINIIDQREYTDHGFFDHWHTTGDNLDAIDPYTLDIVGETVIGVIFSN